MFKKHQYTAVFEPDAEAGGYAVTIPSLPGCISEGDTFEEALKNIKEAAELYLNVIKGDVIHICPAFIEGRATESELPYPEVLKMTKGAWKGDKTRVNDNSI